MGPLPTIPDRAANAPRLSLLARLRMKSGLFLQTISLLALLFGSLASPAPAGANPDDYSQAASLVRNHEWDAGLAILQPMLKAEPRNTQFLNLAGLAFTGKGEVEEANRYFKRALDFDPQFLPALKNLAINEFNSGNLGEADRHLSLVLDKSPGDPVANLFAGQLAYKESNFARAALTLPRAQPFLAKNANLAAQLAISYLALGKSQNAIEVLPYASPAQLDPDLQFLLGVKLAGAGLSDSAVPYLLAATQHPGSSGNAAFDLAVCYLNLKRYEDAVGVLSAARSAGHETSELDNLLAEALEDHHQTQKAIDALRRAIALSPDDENNYLDFASICIDHQDYPAAQKVLDIGLKIHPASDRLLFERGILYAMQDNFHLAEEDFKQATALSPDKNSNYKGLGILYLESGNAAQAVDTLKRRLQQKPNDPDMLYLLGEALLRSGAQSGTPAYNEAQVSFEKSVRLDPKACLPHVSLGKMYLDEERTAEAVAQFEQARAADPNEKSTYWQLATAYRKLGEFDKQRSALAALKSLNDQERSGSHEVNMQIEDAVKSKRVNPN
jgi:tetratricopeptide (TPR) repeat protein